MTDPETVEVKAFEVTWDLQNVLVLEEDGSWGSMPRDALPIDRAKKMQYLNYKYHIGVGQIDIKLYIESFFTKGRMHMMAMSHKQIVVMDEPESVTLAQEYEHLPDLTEAVDHEDEPPPAEKITDDDVLSPAEYPEEPATANEGSLREYYAAQWPGTGNPSAKRQKRTADAPPTVISQSTPPAHILHEVGFTAINQTRSSPRPSTHGEPQEGVSGSQTPTDSRGRLATRPRYSTRDSASRPSTPQISQPEDTSESHVLQVHPPSLVSSFLQRIGLT